MIYETYKISKELINKEIENLKTEKTKKHNEKQEGMMMLLVALSKLLIIKQDVVLKDKKEKTLKNLFPQNELDEMVYKGIFRIIDTPLDTKRTKHKEKPINIIEIEENKNSLWIIDNIRDSLAHNQFEIDYDKQVLHINNKQKKLICDIDFYWLIEFSFILNNNKIENNNKIFKLQPMIYVKPKKIFSFKDLLTRNPLSNKEEIEEYIENIEIKMYKLILKEELEQEEIQQIKLEINKFWDRETKQIISANKPENVEKTIERMKQKYKKYIIDIQKIEIEPKEEKEYLEKRLQEINNYKYLIIDEREEIIIKLKALYYYNYQEENEIIEGLDNIMGTDFAESNENAKKFYMNNPDELIKNKYCYKKEKLLAALYLLGTTLFTIYKEKIYDKQINYEEIDTTEIKTYDIDNPKKLKKQKIELEKIIYKKQEYQQMLIEKIKKLEKNKEKNKEKIEKIIEEIKIAIMEKQQELEELIEQKMNIQIKLRQIKQKDDLEYFEVSNKELIRHIRNAFAHNWIKYKDETATNLMNRIVEIRDYNNNNEVSFYAQAPYRVWINFFNNEIFEKAIKNYQEETYEHTYKKAH